MIVRGRTLFGLGRHFLFEIDRRNGICFNVIPMENTDAYRPRTISETLDAISLAEPSRLESLQDTIQKSMVELNTPEIRWGRHRENGAPVVSEAESEKFFRSRERNINTIHLLQYLQAFAENLPDEKEITSAPVNPQEQLRAFLQYSVELLNAEDVVNAALALNRKLGLVNDSTSWYYRGRVNLVYRELSRRLAYPLPPTLEGYRVLLDTIQDLCCFWFAFRNENRKLVRNSDVCLYLLCRLIRERRGMPPYRQKRI